MKYRLVGLSLISAVALWGCGDDEVNVGAQPAASVHIDGLSANATAYFDDAGVLNASCQTDEDCAAVLGYFHARDRFVQMDLRRRITTGRLTQMLKESVRSVALPIDIKNRALYSTRDGEPVEDAMLAAASDKTRALFDAYARGVNAWIADLKAGRNGATFPREYKNELLFDYDAARVPDWVASDSVATVMALINGLTNDSAFEIEMGRRRAALIDKLGPVVGDTTFRDLFDTRPDIDSPTLANFGGSTSASLWGNPNQCLPSGNPTLLPLSPGASRRLSQQRNFTDTLLGYPGRLGGFGSNNWVVAPSKSKSGNALLSNDPHLGMSNPSVWYLAHLDAKTHGSGDIHAAGMTFAGLPFVVVGQNENIAWGVTTTNFDMTDVYIEEVSADGKTVTYKGQQVPIIKKTATFQYSDGSNTTAELQWVPHHGPVLPRDNDQQPLMTLRWTGNDARSDINAITELEQATNAADAKLAFKQVTTLGQNWVVADREGNIGWFPYNHVPRRPWATGYAPASGPEAVPWLPLDGRGDFEWESYYDYDELPQAFNPADGYLATANNDMTGALFDGDPTDESYGLFQTNVAAGYRHERIVNLLAAKSAHDVASMQSIVSDTHSLIGEQLSPPLIAAAGGLTLSANGQKALAALSGWAFGCPTGLAGNDAAKAALVSDAAVLKEASGCAAFHVIIHKLNIAVLADEGIRQERGPNVALVKLLKGEALLGGEVYWDDVSTDATVETKDDILTAVFNKAGDFLVDKLGADETKWAWGRIHSLTLRSDIDSASSGIVKDYNESGFANDGGLYTVDVANPNDDYTQTHGPSVRFVCEVMSTTGPQCTVQLPGGQPSDNNSPNYLKLLPAFLANQPRPLQMDIAAAEQTAAETIVLGGT